jgi:hypothetical protein
MFCPKCGIPPIEEEQKFCKSCGTNLQAVNEALERGDGKTGVFGVNVGNIVKSVKENVDVETIVKSVKESVSDLTVNKDLRANRRRHREKEPFGSHYENRLKWEEAKTKIAEEKAKRQQLQVQTPKPKEWLAYSWQHNLKSGIKDVLTGAGLGALLYYLGRVAIDAGVLQTIQEEAGHPINGLDQAFRLIFLFAAFPVLVGIGKIIYAAFFAESIATLAERFAPRVIQGAPTEGMPLSRDTAPQDYDSPTRKALSDPPPSVTEGTTKFFEDAPAGKGRIG